MSDSESTGPSASDTFCFEVTDAVYAILKAAVLNTEGPREALAAMTTALAALQIHVQEYVSGTSEYIDAINKAVGTLPSELALSIVSSVLRQCPEKTRMPKPYGEA